MRGLRRQADGVHALLMPDFFRVPSKDEVVFPRADGLAAILVADDGVGVVGYVEVKIVGAPASSTITPCRRAHIETIVVDEARRQAGVGTALMRAAAAWARRRQAADLVLTVWSDNQAAEALYRRLEFEPVARVLRRAL